MAAPGTCGGGPGRWDRRRRRGSAWEPLGRRQINFKPRFLILRVKKQKECSKAERTEGLCGAEGTGRCHLVAMGTTTFVMHKHGLQPDETTGHHRAEAGCSVLSPGQPLGAVAPTRRYTIPVHNYPDNSGEALHAHARTALCMRTPHFSARAFKTERRIRTQRYSQLEKPPAPCHGGDGETRPQCLRLAVAWEMKKLLGLVIPGHSQPEKSPTLHPREDREAARLWSRRQHLWLATAW
ncbi:hypothetical protein QTO34_012312 [Cnephaeus nilssonii]|uniref:Uncharacterized protein n=1 Tax=Cnephaeus nilssonii TaxID=3371016 RepID=A0AA40HDB0_CNENI|nr:hypothetical protein QTO34_012312 [Eptesicus nilssonii]